MTSPQIILLIACILDVFFALLVLFTSKRDYHHYALVVFIVSIVGWCFSVFMIYFSSYSYFWFASSFFFGSLMPGLIVVFIGLFVQYFKEWRHIVYVLIPSGVFAILSFVPNVLFQDPHVEGAQIISSHEGAYALLFNIYVYVYLLSFLYLLLRHFWRSRGIQRMKLLYMVMGFLLFSVFIVLSNVLLPFFGIYSLNGWGPASSIILVAFLVYAVLRYRFLNLRIVIRKSLAYGMSMIVVFLSLYFIVEFLENRFDASPYIALGICVFFLLIIFPYIERLFEKVFLRLVPKGDSLDIVSLTSRLDAILHAKIGETSKVLTHFVSEIAEQFLVDKCGIILQTEKGKVYQSSFPDEGSIKKYEFKDFEFCNKSICALEESIAQEDDISEDMVGLYKEGVSLVMRVSQKGFYEGVLYLGLRSTPWTIEDIREIQQFQKRFEVSIQQALAYDRMMERLLHHTKNQEICG